MRVLVVLLASGLLLPLDVQGQPDPNYTLSLSSASGFQGELVDVTVFLDFPNGENVRGFSFGVCASPGDGSLVDNPCLGGIPND